MSDTERAIEQLLEHAGSRAEPPADVRERVFTAVHAEWIATRRTRRWPAYAAAAMVLLGALAAVVAWNVPRGFEVEVAQTAGLSIDGVPYVRGGTTVTIHPGTTLAANEPTRLVGADGTELRLREGTRMTWRAAAALALDDGALYVDSHGHSGLRIETPMGVVEDVGTRFMVTVSDDAVEVAMRHGTTRIDTAYGHYVAATDASGGDVLRIDPAGARKHTEPTRMPRWEWIHAVHPGYREQSVPRLLAAIADDLGVGLDYASAGVAASVANARMTGDLGNLLPEDALRVVLATNGLALAEAPADRMIVKFESTADSE